MEETVASFEIVKHYVKDLSIENPLGSVVSETSDPIKFETKFGLEINILDADTKSYEVVINCEAKDIDEKFRDHVYLYCNVSYALEIQFNEHFPDSLIDKVLNVNVPQLAFSTIKSILTQNCLYSGYAHIEIEPVDFEEEFLNLEKVEEE